MCHQWTLVVAGFSFKPFIKDWSGMRPVRGRATGLPYCQNQGTSSGLWAFDFPYIKSQTQNCNKLSFYCEGATLAWIFVTKFARKDQKSQLHLPKPLSEWFFFGLGLLSELRRTVIKQDPNSISQFPYWYTQIVTDVSEFERCKGFAEVVFDCQVQLIKNFPWHQHARTQVLRDIHDLSGKMLRDQTKFVIECLKGNRASQETRGWEVNFWNTHADLVAHPPTL